LIKTAFKRARIAFSFLTTIPMGSKNKWRQTEFAPLDMAKSLIFAPVVGLAIGAILLLVWQFASFFPSKPIAAVFVLLAYVLLTGGLHLDGMADTCDGVFSNRPRARMLEIMRDSRIGTNGVIALVITILIYWTAISTLPLFHELNAVVALLLFPVAGRTASIVGSGLSKYARKNEEGLGKNFVELLGLRDAIIGGVLSFLIFIGVYGWRGAILYLITIASTLGGVLFFKKRIGGATGDTLGAMCEFNQIVFILGFIIIGGM